MDHEAPPESLYQIVDEIILEGAITPPRENPFTPVQINAIPPARRLCKGILTQDGEMAEEGARGLAGLGGGLTPAGDDFIMGVLLGLRTMVPSEIVSHHSEVILSNVISRTNALSAAWLQAAAKGEVHETWRRFLDALVTEPHAEMQVVLRRILDVGHSSGADALAGFLTICSLESEHTS